MCDQLRSVIDPIPSAHAAAGRKDRPRRGRRQQALAGLGHRPEARRAGCDARLHLSGRAHRVERARAGGVRRLRCRHRMRRLGGLDLMVHSIAFAQAHDLAGRFTDTKRDDYRLAIDISAYSLVAMTQRAEPLMEARGGGSIVTMTYLGGERAIPGYNVMGV